MAQPGASVSNTGFTRIAAHVRAIKQGAELARQRAIVTVVRRLSTETVRTISKEILNLPQNRVRPYIQARLQETSGSTAIVLSASNQRLPLTDYSARWNKSKGVTVTTWRDAGAKQYPHAFFRSDAPGVWQRVPWTGAKFGGGSQARAPSGLVERLPVVQLKGPDMRRVFLPEGTRHAHGSVAERLKEVGRDVLAAEVQRLRDKVTT